MTGINGGMSNIYERKPEIDLVNLVESMRWIFKGITNNLKNIPNKIDHVLIFKKMVEHTCLQNYEKDKMLDFSSLEATAGVI